MKNNNIPRFSIFIILPIGLLFFLFSQSQTLSEKLDFLSNSTIVEDEKQKGAHVFGIRDSTNFQFLTRNNIEWVTLVPWGDQKDYDSERIEHHRGDSLRRLRRDASFLRRLELVHAAGFKIFVKPHVWMNEPSEGKWRSDIFPTNEKNWELWKKSYREFILRYAILAEQGNAEMFCIGTEFSRLSIEKAAFWKALIQEVRGVYTGKITYAANWYHEYEKISFWEELDYIGIQAYFPLVKNTYPSTKEISKGWRKYLPLMKSISRKYNRKILFTEIGYKSTADSAINPWEWIDYSSDDEDFSNETQANCYEAFFNTIWEKEWFAGAHIWQLRSDSRERKGGKRHLDFTPLKKPAEKIIAKGFE